MTNYNKDFELLDAYQQLPINEQVITNLLSIKLTSTVKKDIPRLVKDWMPEKTTQVAISKMIDTLVEKKFLFDNNGIITVNYNLLLQLFPTLIKNKNCRSFLDIIKRYSYYSWSSNREDKLREFLIAVFEGSHDRYNHNTEHVLKNPQEYFYFFTPMLDIFEYHTVFRYNIDFTFNLLRIIQRHSVFYFEDIDLLANFFEVERPFNGINHQCEIQFAEIELFRGNISEASKRLEKIENHDALLLKSALALLKGDYDNSVKLFEKARTTGHDGTRRSKPVIYPEREFFYWLAFVFDPARFKPEKADTFITKLLKGRAEDVDFLLALLFYLKKDIKKAEQYVNQFILHNQNLATWCKLMVTYIVCGKIDRRILPFSQSLLNKLEEEQLDMLIPDLVYMHNASGEEPTIGLSEEISKVEPLLSRLVKQEAWEMQLDGLAQLLTGQKVAVEKLDKSTRICYLVNFEKEIVQPILQSYNAKSGWSAGRNIAMKKLRQGDIEEMTDQDKRIASTIGIYSNYYGSDVFDFNYKKVLTELCGHPLLFLFANPSVSVELIKADAEIYTEENGNKITLKTNINENIEENIKLIKETQTRYKLIVLNGKQREIIRIIGKGITIPKKGQEKLMSTVSKLSGLVTVHSHLAESTSEIKSIGADPRIRVQIVPMGDGLKAEIFVKPLSTEPPYLKPGKGGKVVYGMLNGEKCQAIRKMDIETSYANALNNTVNSRLDVDLIEDVAFFEYPYDCLELLETIASHTDIAVVEWPEGERFRIKKSVSFGQMHLNVKRAAKWFELDGQLDIDEETVLSVSELLKINSKSHGRFIELGNGEFVALTDELKKQLDELETMVQVEKNKTTINPYATHILNDLSGKVASFKTDKGWKELQQKIRNADLLKIEIPSTLDAELRQYQEEGFRWMARLNEWGAGACLADDMGLGKTIQTIALMLRLAEKGPALVVCPASVAANWCNELNKFAPTLNPVLLKTGNRDQVFNSLAVFDVLIVSYGLLQSEEENISKINWAIAVLDEAHAIKNFQTKSSKAAMNIAAGFKLLLTGTPVQNHLGELWNLFQFCNPGLLGTQQQFINRYVKNDVPEQRNLLKKLIAPFILRRTKNKVLEELPAKTEITHTVELSKEEMAFYEALRRSAIATIENNNGPAGQQHLQALAEITKLRLACCNTALVNKEIALHSSKLAAFLEIIDELRENNHRALVFSQFVGHLAIVRQELDLRKISYQYLDGSTSMPDREQAVKEFQRGKSDLFLISLKAGGLGLNLTAADYVIHLDPWWNPAIEDQASDRAHRMGQTRPVTIYRLVAHNTIEEKIVQLHATKRNMADSLLEGSDQGAKLSTSEILEILKGVQ